MNKFAVIDFETSGLSPNKGDRAIEVGIVLIENGKITKKFDSLINPGFSITPKITQITTITNEMLKKAPSANDVFLKVHDFIRGAVLVAHNANFDKKFFEYEMNRLNLKENHTFLCSLLLSRRLYQWAPDHKLITLVDILNIGEEGTFHRALSDALMTAKLFNRICSDLSSLYEDKIDPKFIEKYQKTAKSKLKYSPILKKNITTHLKNNKISEEKAPLSTRKATSTRNILRSQKEHYEKNDNMGAYQSKPMNEQENQQLKSRPYEDRRDDAIRKIRASRNARSGRGDDVLYESEAQLNNAKVTDVYDVKAPIVIKKTYEKEISRLNRLINDRKKYKKLEVGKAQQKLTKRRVYLKKGGVKAFLFPDIDALIETLLALPIVMPISFLFILLPMGIFDAELSGMQLTLTLIIISYCLMSFERVFTVKNIKSKELSEVITQIEKKYGDINTHENELENLIKYKNI